MNNNVSYQGVPGAYSEIVCRKVAPDYTPLPCPTVEDVFESITLGNAAIGVIPLENSAAGRVADVYSLLPESSLYIIGEHYEPICHHLLALPEATLADIKTAQAHIQALTQCKDWLRAHNIEPVSYVDNGTAAADLIKAGDKSRAAIASARAGELYGLQSLAVDIADVKKNTTRFLIVSGKPAIPAQGDVPCVTTLVFKVRSVPAALYKALGGFATNGINLTKIESYFVGTQFESAGFYVDVEAHPEDVSLKLALDELRFFAETLRILGTYPASPFRLKKG